MRYGAGVGVNLENERAHPANGCKFSNGAVRVVGCSLCLLRRPRASDAGMDSPIRHERCPWGYMIKSKPIRPPRATAPSAGDVRPCIGPLGEALTLEAMPKLGARWTARRKSEVVAAVSGRLLTLAEVSARYGITLEEFGLWAHGMDRSGLRALQATKVQHYRALHRRRDS